jgi:hypothetical protein
MRKTENHPSGKDLLELLCAPEATDDIEDISFEETDDEAEQSFIEKWIEGEREKNPPPNDQKRIDI